MNYAFKMMAVVLALGMLVLQGCQTDRYNATSVSALKISKLSYHTPLQRVLSEETYNISSLPDIIICPRRVGRNKGFYIDEAKRRGLNCGVKNNNETVIASKPKNDKIKLLSAKSDSYICKNASNNNNPSKWMYIREV